MTSLNWVGLSVGAVAIFLVIFGERIAKAIEARRVRRHKCPRQCEESRRCRCGCNGLHSVGERQEKCAVCGQRIVYADMEITQENPAPKGFTSWGWERDREFRRARHRDRE